MTADVFAGKAAVRKGLKLRAKAIFRNIPEPKKAKLGKTIKRLKRVNGI